jgi:hypothetical protein
MTSTLPVLNDDWLLSRLPPDLRDQLPPEVQTMLAVAAADRPWRRHPVDIHLSVPLPGYPIFIRLVAGPERRSPIRREVERRTRRSPWLANLLFVFGAVGLFYSAIIIGALLLTAILE